MKLADYCKITKMIGPNLICLCSLLISLTSGAAPNQANKYRSQVSKIWSSQDLNRPRTSGVVLFKLKKNVTLQDLNITDLAAHNFLNNSNSIDFAESTLLDSSKIYEFNFNKQITSDLLLNPVSAVDAVLSKQTRLSEEEFSAQLMQTGLVEYAEPDYAHLPDFNPNDTLITSQWYINRLGLPNAWDVSTGSNQVQVLVCDTGVLSGHPDLKGNVVTQGHNFVDDTNNTEPSGNAHGTLVSGLIGAKGNNSAGIAGINWNIQIVPGKISNEASGLTHTSTMVKCIQWAIDHNIRVVNLSYNGSGSETLAEASKNLFDHNGLLVLTIGNQGEEVTFPKNPYTLRVGAVDHYDYKAVWSNTGEAIDLVAPGTSINSTDASGGYSRVQGTSFSAPLVAGTAALLLSIEPTLTNIELKQIILEATKDLGNPGFDKIFGHGLLDVANAVLKLQKLKQTKPSLIISGYDWGVLSPMAVYGEDNRKDIYEITPQWQKIARSIAGRVAIDRITPSGSGWQLSGALMSNKECPGNKYSNQITVPSCTGFLAKNNILITAAHCMKSAEDCSNNHWIFDYAFYKQSDMNGPYTKVESNQIYKCKKVLARKYDNFGNIDYAIIELDRAVADRQPLQLGFDLPLVAGQNVVDIGHSNGLPLKFKDSAKILNITSDNLAFDSDLDLFQGDSGSPVFDANTGMVIGITSHGHSDHVHADEKSCRQVRVCLPGDVCYPSTASRITNLRQDLK